MAELKQNTAASIAATMQIFSAVDAKNCAMTKFFGPAEPKTVASTETFVPR